MPAVLVAAVTTVRLTPAALFAAPKADVVPLPAPFAAPPLDVAVLSSPPVVEPEAGIAYPELSEPQAATTGTNATAQTEPTQIALGPLPSLENRCSTDPIEFINRISSGRRA
ncbi:MAG TPA: hypothetical protein VI197_12695 [Polyangiaceae bacterium]